MKIYVILLKFMLLCLNCGFAGDQPLLTPGLVDTHSQMLAGPVIHGSNGLEGSASRRRALPVPPPPLPVISPYEMESYMASLLPIMSHFRDVFGWSHFLKKEKILNMAMNIFHIMAMIEEFPREVRVQSLLNAIEIYRFLGMPLEGLLNMYSL